MKVTNCEVTLLGKDIAILVENTLNFSTLGDGFGLQINEENKANEDEIIDLCYEIKDKFNQLNSLLK